MTEAELNRLRWACRRGMLELDDWLGGFLESEGRDLDGQGQAEFSRLLEQEDPDLYAWLTGRAAPPAEYSPLVERIKDYMVRPK